jgi:hypothetical protein
MRVIGMGAARFRSQIDPTVPPGYHRAATPQRTDGTSEPMISVGFAHPFLPIARVVQPLAPFASEVP